MTIAPKGWDISDSNRDAQRYKRLLSALDHAIQEIRAVEMIGSIGGIDIVLNRLLPVLTETLNAEDAFAALLREGEDGERYLEITAAYPSENLRGCRLEYTERLQEVIRDGRQIIDPYWEKQQDIIPGLEVFDAASAVLVRMESADETRIVGVCSKRNPELEVFLAADGMALDSIVELVAIGARIGEGRRRELEGIQKTSAAISAELELDELLPMIAEKAADVFGAPATSLMLWDKAEENLVIMASEGLSDEYVLQQCISKEKVYAAAASNGGFQPLVTPDLRLTPFGQPDLIESEHLCSALSVPLFTSGQLIGVLNIYSRDRPREFRSHEIELAEIFANQAAIAIQNAQLRKRELEGLLATSDAIRATLDPDFLLTLITSKASEVFGAPATSLMLWDEMEEKLVIMASEGLSDEYVLQQRIPKERVHAAATPNGEFRPLVTPDLRLEPFGRLELYEKECLCTVLSTPLLVSDKLIGVLNIYSKNEPREFTPDEIELATIFANQAAVAIEITQLHQQTRQRGEQLAALDQIALDIAKRLETKELLRAIVERATELIQGTGGGVYLFIEADETFRSEAVYGLPSELEGVRIEKDKGVIGQVLRTQQPVAVADYQRWSDRLRILDGHKLAAVVGAPIMSEDHFLGAIAVHDTKEGRVFGKAEKELLHRLGNHVAIALENARAYMAERETKNYLDRLISSSLDGIIAIDDDGWVTIFNEGAERILGYSRDEVINQGKRVDELYGSLEIAGEIKRQLISKEKLDNYETTVLAKDGQTVPILLSATLLRDKVGKSSGSVGFFKDLRPLRKAEAELRMILDTINTVANARSLGEGLDALAENMVKGLNVTFCHILLLDEDGQSLDVEAAYPDSHSSTLRWEPGFGKVVSLVDVPTMKYLLEIPLPRVFRKGEMVEGQEVVSYVQMAMGLDDALESALVIPLKASGGSFGICILGEVRIWERSPFTDDKMTLASSIASQAATLIDRIRAYEAIRRRVKQLEDLREVGQQVARSAIGAPKDVLDRIARGTCQVIGADFAVIYPYHADLGIYDVRNTGFCNLLNSSEQFSIKSRLESNSMTNVVLRRKRRLVVDDVETGWDRNREIEIQASEGKFLRREQVQSFVGLGLCVGDEPVGVLFANFRRPHRLTDDELDTIEVFANQAAVIIYQACLFQRWEKGHKAIQSTHQITRLVGTTDTSRPVWQAILEGALNVTGAQRGRIMLWDETQSQLVPEVDSGFSEQDKRYPGDRDAEPCELLNKVVQDRACRLILDTAEEPLAECCRELCPDIGSLLAMPVLHGAAREPVGAIILESPDQAAFGTDDKELVESLAVYADIAVQSAKRYAEIQENALLREGLLKAGQGITALQEPQMVLQSIADSVIEALTCDVVTVYTYDHTNGDIGFPPVVSGKLHSPDSLVELEYVSKESVVGQLLASGRPHFADDSVHDPLMSTGCFVQREGICSSAGIPLRVGDETVGILFVNYRRLHPFAPQERSAIELFATQAAIAIHNARLYDGVQRRTAHLQALYEASKAITAGSIGFERKQILDRILEQAIESVTGGVGREAILGTIQLLVEKTNELVFTNFYPPKDFPDLVARLGDRILLDLEKAKDGKIGVTGRTAVTKQAQIVRDVREDPDYIEYSLSTKSELAVPLLDGDRLIGVLDVESSEVGAFDQYDVETLKALSDLAVVAIRNAEQAEQLSRTNALALMGAWGADVVHDVNREVGAIRRASFVLQQRSDLSSEVKEQLGDIDRYAGALALPELPEHPLELGCALELRDAPLLDEVIRTEVEHIQPAYPHVFWRCNLKCPEVQVAMHEQWLRRLLRHLIHNAVKAMPLGKEIRLVIIRTAVQGPMVEVQVEDTGKGVRPEIEPLLFQQPILHEDGRRGQGLLLVRFLAEQHGGRANLIWSRPGEGACFAFRIPLARPTAGPSGQVSKRS